VKEMKELLNIYINAFLLAIILELSLTFLGMPLAAKHKLKNTFSVKEYLADLLLLNFLTVPLVAFGIFALMYIKKISSL
jgi:hypothetical protein